MQFPLFPSSLSLSLSPNIPHSLVFQGLTLTVTHTETTPDQPKWRDYFQLWANMFEAQRISVYQWGYPWNELVFEQDLQEHMFSQIYDKIIESSMSLINKLDLSCRAYSGMLRPVHSPKDLF